MARTGAVRWGLAAALAVLLPAGAAGAGEPRAETVAKGDWDGARRQATQVARDWMKRLKVAGLALAVVDGGRVVFADGLGWADAKEEVPVRPETIFRAGDLAGAVTVAAALELADEGRLDLHAPVTKYLPSFGMRPRFPGARPVTVMDLCTHLGGLPVTVAKGARSPSPPPFESVVEALRDEDPPRAPGAAFGWSEAGLSVLGAVIQAAAGKDFEDFVRESLLVPAGMATATYGPDRDRSALGARPHRKGKPEEEPLLRDVPARGLNASVLDLASFLAAALSGGRAGERVVLKPESAASLWTRQNGAVAADLDLSVGLGWIGSAFLSLDFAGAGPAWHAGGPSQDGFHGMMVALPAQGLGVVVLANSVEAEQAVGRVAEEALWAALQAKAGLARPPEPETQPDAPPLPEEKARAWEGDWATWFGHVKVWRKGDGLRADAFGRTFHLVPRRDGRLAVRYKVAGLVSVPLGRFDRVGLSVEPVAGQDAMVAEGDGVRLASGWKVPRVPVPESWARRAGDYVVDNLGRDVTQVARPALRLEDGVLFVEFEMPRVAGDLRIRLPLSVESDETAVLVGAGPGLGETFRVVPLPDGGEGLRYSGYVLRRK